MPSAFCANIPATFTEHPDSVRERREFLNPPKTPTQQVSDYFYQQHLRQQEQEQKDKAEAERRNAELKARWKQEDEQHRRNVLLNITFEQHGATPEERRLVTRLVEQRHGQNASADVYGVTLLNLREVRNHGK